MDASKTGIQFAGETAKLSDYKTAVFMEGGEQSLKQLEENSFDGVILSNVLDVMPKDDSVCEYGWFEYRFGRIQ